MKQSDVHKSTNYRENTSIFQFGAGDVEIVGNNWKSQQKKKEKTRKTQTNKQTKITWNWLYFVKKNREKDWFFSIRVSKVNLWQEKKEREKKAAFPKELKKVKMWH